MNRKKPQEPIEIDLAGQDVMNWINEMRNSQPSAAERRKIRDWKYCNNHRKERAEANRKWREEHAEHYTEIQKKYHSDPKVLKKKREAARERYHSDPEWREAMLSRQRARYHAMTPEQKSEYIRKQNERARIRRAKAKAKKLENQEKETNK